MSQDEEAQKLIQAFMTDDELALVVRSHIKIEELVDQAILLHIVEEKYLNRIKLEFSEKVDLAAALGMPEDLVKPLSVLGSLRNRFAHKTDSELNKSDVNNLYKAFSSDGKEALQKTVARNRDDVCSKAREYKDMSIKEKFVLMTIYLHAWLRDFLHEEVVQTKPADV